MCDWRERWHEDEDEDMEETDDVDEDVDGGGGGDGSDGHPDQDPDEDEDDVTGTAGGRSVSRLSSETVTDPDLMFSCDVRDVVVVTPSISSIMSEDGMDDSVPVTSGDNLRPNQKYHLTSSSGMMISRCASLHDDRLLTVGSKSLTGSSGSHSGSVISSIVVPTSHSSRANHRRRHRHQSVVDDLDDEADVVAAAAARVIRHTNQVHGQEDEEEDDPVACMDDEDGMVDLSLDIKHEKLLTVAVVDDDEEEDDEDDVSCILRDPPLNHFKTSRIKTHAPAQQHPPERKQTQPGHGIVSMAPAAPVTVSKSTHTIAPVTRIPDSSCNSTSNVNGHNRHTGQPLSALQQRSPLLGSLIANGVSSTTGSSAHQHVSSSATLLPAPTPTATVVLTPGHVLTSQASQETLTVASSTTTTPLGNGVQHHQQPLDIKILPANIIQLASNLASVFPGAGNGGQPKQQIAIQLLREDGTSIIVPITTTTMTRSIVQHSGPSAGGSAGGTVTMKPETTGNGTTTTVLLQTATDHHRQTIITTQNLVQQQQPQPLQQQQQQQPKLHLVQHHNSIVQQQSSSAIQSTSQMKVELVGNEIRNTDTNSCHQQQHQQQDSSSSSDSSDRPFKCELCNSTFTRLGNYTRHKKIHSLPTKEDQRFRCEICSKSFIQRCDLARHLHIHRGTEPHRCPQCGKGYIRHSDLVTHQRFHNKEKPFACPHCSKGFCQRGDLNRHLRSIHLQLKPILCSHCHKKFAKEETLLRHINSTHRDKLLE